MAARRLISLGAGLAVAAVGAFSLWRLANVPPEPKRAPSAVAISFAAVPLAFEPNAGLWSDEVAFVARGRGGAVWLLNDGWAFGDASALVRATLQRARVHEPPVGEGKLAGTANYYIGNQPSQWRAGVPLYSEVRYPEIYPGIDLVFHGNGKNVELDFVVNPGGRPEEIRVALEGARGMDLDRDGNLHVRTANRETVWMLPVVFQVRDGRRERVQGVFEVTDSGIGFRVGTYDLQRQLVIDPTLAYATYLGASGTEFAKGIAVDSSGNAYVVGTTNSTNFPTQGAVQPSNDGGFTDAYISKLDPFTSTLVYSTYLGGSSEDYAAAIAVDPSGNAYVTGYTFSPNFPIQGAVQATYDGGMDSFVVKIGPSGSPLVYATYLGGNTSDWAQSIAVDSSGSAYVSGYTRSTNFPTQNALQPTHNGGTYDGFVTKLSPAGSTLVYSTYLGGNSDEDAVGIAVDSSGSAYVAGSTQSTNFPTVAAFQPTYDGGIDAYVAKLAPSGSTLTYSTYFGGSGLDEPFGVAVDPSGNAYIAGRTTSLDLEMQNATQPVFGGNYDAFVTKLGPTGSTLVYSTYLGGTGFDGAAGLAVDSNGNAYVVGRTGSANFPTQNALKTTLVGIEDGVVAKISATGSLVYSTYIGGSSSDEAVAVAVDSADQAFIAGDTASTDLPTQSAFQPAYDGGWEAFVAVISDPPAAPDGGPPGGVYNIGCDCASTGGAIGLPLLGLAALGIRRAGRVRRDK